MSAEHSADKNTEVYNLTMKHIFDDFVNKALQSANAPKPAALNPALEPAPAPLPATLRPADEQPKSTAVFAGKADAIAADKTDPAPTSGPFEGLTSPVLTPVSKLDMPLKAPLVSSKYRKSAIGSEYDSPRRRSETETDEDYPKSNRYTIRCHHREDCYRLKMKSCNFYHTREEREDAEKERDAYYAEDRFELAGKRTKYSYEGEGDEEEESIKSQIAKMREREVKKLLENKITVLKYKDSYVYTFDGKAHAKLYDIFK